MDAPNTRNTFFGMLFLKRMSDVFDEQREEIPARSSNTLPEAEVKSLLEDKISYGDTFFVPPRARWNEGFTDENGQQQPAIKNLHHNIGEIADESAAALEEANEPLEGVLKHINFNEEINGKAQRL